jgi:hypothetical protein
MDNCCCFLACVAATGIAVAADATGNVSARLQRALVDSTAHASVAGIGWGAATWPPPSQSRYLGEVLLSAILASIIDLDHFIAARSFELEAATALPTRPFGHSVTFILASSAVAAFILGPRRGLLLLHAWLSHNLRDSHRRGFYLVGIGSTPAVPYELYIVLSVVFPLCIRAFVRVLPSRRTESSTFPLPPALASSGHGHLSTP